ncbi:MAG: FecR domain-containing protein [Verrucomicrobiota bacterium]
MKTSNLQPDTPSRKAAEWLLAIQEASGDAELAARFDAWLAESPKHIEAWTQVTEVYGQMGSGGLEEANQAVSVKRRRSRRIIQFVALGAAACIAFLSLPGVFLRIEADHVTPTAEVEKIVLEDKSRIHLAPESALSAEYSPEERSLELIKGRAFFDVVSDVERPFSVTVAGLTVTAIGTAFHIDRGSGKTKVAVSHGRVRLSGGSEALDGLELGAGEYVSEIEGQVEQGQMAVREMDAWMDGRVVAREETLQRIVAHLERYHSGSIVIRDESLKMQRVTGVFSVEDTLGTLRAVAESCGAQVKQITPWLLIVEKAE